MSCHGNKYHLRKILGNKRRRSTVTRKGKTTGTLESASRKFLLCEEMTEQEKIEMREHLAGIEEQVERETRECKETGVGLPWSALEAAGVARRVDGRWEWL